MNNKKIMELYNCLLERNSWIKPYDKFSNQTSMMKWFYGSLTDIEAKAKAHDRYCQTIIDYYNQYKMEKKYSVDRKKLPFETKVDIAYQLYLEGRLPMTRSTETFSDGTKIGTWLYANKFTFNKLSNKDPRLKELYDFLEDRKKNRYRKVFNLNMEKASIILKECAVMPDKNTNIMLDEKHNLYNWLYFNRKKIYTLSKHDNTLAQQLVDTIETLKPDFFEIVKNKVK